MRKYFESFASMLEIQKKSPQARPGGLSHVRDSGDRDM
jgi:hypothetical protein